MRPVISPSLLGALILACGTTPISIPTQVDIGNIQTAAVQTALAQLIPQADPTTMVAPTGAPVQPTATQRADPNRLNPGMYIVGTDIMPGLYVGQAGTDSCYWERLKDLAGTVDSILANDNSIGQYYVEVYGSDYALETRCPLQFLSALPAPKSQMPSTLDPGMYLVGIDMQPGTYKGQAGSDTCYWERLANLGGGFDSILANDNSTGQFYVQVSPTDRALSTRCLLELVQQ